MTEQLKHGSELTVEEALKIYPDLLKEKVRIVEASEFKNPSKVRLQLVGYGQSRTNVLNKVVA